MGRITGSWLSGPTAAAPRPAGWAGQRLGLPEQGAGAVAGFGVRTFALAVDLLLSWLVATLLVGSTVTGVWSSVVFLGEYAVFTALTGQSAGMRVVGLRVVRPGGSRPGVGWALLRTLLLALLLPPLFADTDLRGMHDRATGTVVVRAR